jgi:hypothetical protein
MFKRAIRFETLTRELTGGVTLTVGGTILGRLPVGTTFTVISNTRGHTYRRDPCQSPRCLDNNDLTLTVVR